MKARFRIGLITRLRWIHSNSGPALALIPKAGIVLVPSRCSKGIETIAANPVTMRIFKSDS